MWDKFVKFFASHRKNYFINPKFQLKYSVLLSILGTITAIIIGMSILSYLTTSLNILHEAGLSGIPSLLDIIKEELDDLVISISFLFSIQIVALLLIGIYTTHKICGPIFVLERQMRQIIKNNYTEKMSIRKTDDFQSVPKVYNRMLDKLQTKIQEDIAFLKLVEAEIELIEETKDISKEKLESLNKLKTQAKILREQKNQSIK